MYRFLEMSYFEMAYILAAYFEMTYFFMAYFRIIAKKYNVWKNTSRGNWAYDLRLHEYTSYNLTYECYEFFTYMLKYNLMVRRSVPSFVIPRQPYLPSHGAAGYVEYYCGNLHENLVVRTTTLKYLNAMEYTLLFCGKMHKKSIISGLNNFLELFSTRYKESTSPRS